MNSKNILHLITPYMFSNGSWVYSLLKNIKSFESYVFTQKTENLEMFPFDNLYSADDLPYIKKNINKLYRSRTDNYGLFFNKHLSHVKPKLIHAHFGFEAARWFNFILKTNLPLITTFYGLDVSRLGKIEKWKKRYYPLFKYGKIFLAEGNYLKKQLILIGCPENKIRVQHIGVNIEKYPVKQNYSINSEKIKIIQVSSFREKKGIEYSLKAISELKNNFTNFIFIIVGNGETELANKKINNLINELNIKDYVELKGSLPHHKTLELIKECDIFLHPSVEAKDGDNEGGSPVIITEASAIGLPIVSTFHCDIPEVVLNNESGFLVNERNHLELTEKLLLLINNIELRQNMGLKGRQHVLKEYNLHIQIKKIENIYTEVIND